MKQDFVKKGGGLTTFLIKRLEQKGVFNDFIFFVCMCVCVCVCVCVCGGGGGGLAKKRGVTFLRGEGSYPGAHYEQVINTST